jgi:site-specific DNA recombinase
MKKVIQYLRFSSDDQSHHSIERQEIVNAHWIKSNDAELIDTFKDEGYSARTFDRPDVKQLFDFIKKNYRTIDYLVVAELTRFSRDTGDAINTVKKIQLTYGVRIVSASRSIIYDCSDSNSFFLMGLEFLLGNSENIKRQNDINGGIYTAKVGRDGQGGRWIKGGPAPFGFIKDRSGKLVKLQVNEDHAVIIKYIFQSFLANVPIKAIYEGAQEKGFTRTGHACINEILKNPVYMGYQYVKAWKDSPGGMFPIKELPAIIPPQIWRQAQNKMKTPKTLTIISDQFPLRQVLKCFCSLPLTAAPSKSRNGNYYGYYKCKVTGHNNISAIKAHDQMTEILKLLSIPSRMIAAIKARSEDLLEDRLKENKKVLAQKQKQLSQTQEQISSLEEKWINNQCSFETYNTWHSDLNDKRRVLTGEIELLTRDQDQVYLLLQDNLLPLTDLNYLYSNAATVKKQELIRQVFDSQLYYRTGIYRTGYIMPVFSHNILTLKHKRLLIVDAMNEKAGDVEVPGLLSNRFISFLSFIESMKVA